MRTANEDSQFCFYDIHRIFFTFFFFVIVFHPAKFLSWCCQVYTAHKNYILLFGIQRKGIQIGKFLRFCHQIGYIIPLKSNMMILFHGMECTFGLIVNNCHRTYHRCAPNQFYNFNLTNEKCAIQEFMIFDSYLSLDFLFILILLVLVFRL